MVMISATPALSSAPRSVEPSVTISVLPRTSAMAGNCFSLKIAPWPRSMSFPSKNTSRAFTFSPLAAGEVSMWEIKATAGAFTPPVAGSVPITLPHASVLTSCKPSASISALSSRPRSICRWVDGEAVLSSLEAVEKVIYCKNLSLAVISYPPTVFSFQPFIIPRCGGKYHLYLL